MIQARAQLAEISRRYTEQSANYTAWDTTVAERLATLVGEAQAQSDQAEAAYAAGDIPEADSISQQLLDRLLPDPSLFDAQHTEGFTIDCSTCAVQTFEGVPHWRITSGAVRAAPQRLLNSDFTVTVRFMPLRVGEFNAGALTVGFREAYSVGNAVLTPTINSCARGGPCPARYWFSAGEPAVWHYICDFSEPPPNQWSELTVAVKAKEVQIEWDEGLVCRHQFDLMRYFGDVVISGHDVLIDRIVILWHPI